MNPIVLACATVLLTGAAAAAADPWEECVKTITGQWAEERGVWSFNEDGTFKLDEGKGPTAFAGQWGIGVEGASATSCPLVQLSRKAASSAVVTIIDQDHIKWGIKTMTRVKPAGP